MLLSWLSKQYWEISRKMLETPLYRWLQSLRVTYDVPKITQIACCRAGIQIQVSLLHAIAIRKGNWRKTTTEKSISLNGDWGFRHAQRERSFGFLLDLICQSWLKQGFFFFPGSPFYGHQIDPVFGIMLDSEFAMENKVIFVFVGVFPIQCLFSLS